MAIPAMALLQQHDARRDRYSDWTCGAAACSDRSWEAFRTWGVRNWGRNRAVKTNRLIGPIANLNGHYFQPSLSVCLSVCLSWPALLPFNVDRLWRNLVTRTLVRSSLAATIMVQIGRRGTAWRLFENFKKFSKITEFECQNSGPSFFCVCVSCVL